MTVTVDPKDGSVLGEERGVARGVEAVETVEAGVPGDGGGTEKVGREVEGCAVATVVVVVIVAVVVNAPLTRA